MRVFLGFPFGRKRITNPHNRRPAVSRGGRFFGNAAEYAGLWSAAVQPHPPVWLSDWLSARGKVVRPQQGIHSVRRLRLEAGEHVCVGVHGEADL